MYIKLPPQHKIKAGELAFGQLFLFNYSADNIEGDSICMKIPPPPQCNLAHQVGRVYFIVLADKKKAPLPTTDGYGFIRDVCDCSPDFDTVPVDFDYDTLRVNLPNRSAVLT